MTGIVVYKRGIEISVLTNYRVSELPFCFIPDMVK